MNKYIQHSKTENILLWFSLGFTDCFEPSCDLLNYSNVTCPKSNHTLEFENRLNRTQECFTRSDDIPSSKNNTGHNTCSNCTDQYNNLSNYYNTIRLKKSDKFCFSIKYKVNCALRQRQPQVRSVIELVGMNLS